jgi:hypothetical protein
MSARRSLPAFGKPGQANLSFMYRNRNLTTSTRVVIGNNAALSNKATINSNTLRSIVPNLNHLQSAKSRHHSRLIALTTRIHTRFATSSAMSSTTDTASTSPLGVHVFFDSATNTLRTKRLPNEK